MQGKLSPMTLQPLDPELVAAPSQRAKVLAFVAARARGLLSFANAHGASLVLQGKDAPKQKKLKQLPLGEAVEIIKRELGLSGTANWKQVVDEAVDQLGVDASDMKLVEMGMACVDALGLAQEADEDEADEDDLGAAGLVLKTDKWAKRVAEPRTTTPRSWPAPRSTGRNATSMLLAQAQEQAAPLAKELFSLCSARGRRRLTCSPWRVDGKAEFRIKVMTGDEEDLAATDLHLQEAIDRTIAKSTATSRRSACSVRGQDAGADRRLGEQPIVDGARFHLISAASAPAGRRGGHDRVGRRRPRPRSTAPGDSNAHRQPTAAQQCARLASPWGREGGGQCELALHALRRIRRATFADRHGRVDGRADAQRQRGRRDVHQRAQRCASVPRDPADGLPDRRRRCAGR